MWKDQSCGVGWERVERKKRRMEKKVIEARAEAMVREIVNEQTKVMVMVIALPIERNHSYDCRSALSLL